MYIDIETIENNSNSSQMYLEIDRDSFTKVRIWKLLEIEKVAESS